MTEESYVVCNSKCKHPAYTKEEIDEKIEEINLNPNVYSGNTVPDDNLGKDGDLYIRYWE